MDFTDPPKNSNGAGRSFGPPEVMPDVSDLEDSVDSDDGGGGDDTTEAPKDDVAEKFKFLGDTFGAPFGHKCGPEGFLGYKLVLLVRSA
jgi:hypothetical protein